MKTEIKEKYKSGFFVNEIELVRIKDSQNEQIKKSSSGVDAEFKFEVKYKNGVISEPTSIDEVLAEENDGSKSIVSLTMAAKHPTNDEIEIIVSFNDINETNSDDAPINYSVKSDDKDWTFVSASTISERLLKVKSRDASKWIGDSLPFYLINLVMLVFFTYISIRINNSKYEQIKELNRLKMSSKDMYDYVHKVNLMIAGGDFDPNRALSSIMPWLIGILILYYVMSRISNRIISWYPKYTFYWGDRMSKYDSKISKVKFVVGGIILAIILGVVGNYISSRLF
jgi:hypothetical protein